MIIRNGRTLLSAVIISTACWMAGAIDAAQPATRAVNAPATAQAAAPIDLTGYWVSYVTEEWRYRMMTPAKGDTEGVPLNAAGQAAAKSWDPAADEANGLACKAYGAGGIMRIPGRLHITWRDANTLQIETDAGRQTRLFHFNQATPAPAEPTWQGHSLARWEGPAGGRGESLAVTTTQMRPGYLRRNGAPYGARATLTEYFDLAALPDETPLLMVTTVVTDPEHLAQPFVITTQFKKESNNKLWNPEPCKAVW